MSELEREKPITREEFERLERSVARLGELMGRLRKFAPGPSEQRARWTLFILELSGLTIAAVGTAFVYPPGAALLVGGWMLADVIVSRRIKPKKDR